jgi:AraC-like DNA-binding protein
MVWPLAAELSALGVDVDAVLLTGQLSQQKIQNPDVRIPFEDLIAIGQAAVDATGDLALGLHLAEHYRPNLFGVLDYLARSCMTLGEAIKQLCRYNRLLQDAAETLLEIQGERALLWQRTLGGVHLPPGMTENSMANLIVIGRHLTGIALAPIEALFTHPEPAYSAEHRRIFGSRVRFGADRDGLVLATNVLSVPLKNPDPGLRAILERHADQLLEHVPRVARFSHRVRELVAGELKEGNPTAEAIAKKLGTSERTLRRKLQEDGTTYDQLLDELRRELAERYLQDPKVSTDEAALMLGYSEPSAFRRAFRRWHGTSPAAYRRKRTN